MNDKIFNVWILAEKTPGKQWVTAVQQEWQAVVIYRKGEPGGQAVPRDQGTLVGGRIMTARRQWGEILLIQDVVPVGQFERTGRRRGMEGWLFSLPDPMDYGPGHLWWSGADRFLRSGAARSPRRIADVGRLGYWSPTLLQLGQWQRHSLQPGIQWNVLHLWSGTEWRSILAVWRWFGSSGDSCHTWMERWVVACWSQTIAGEGVVCIEAQLLYRFSYWFQRHRIKTYCEGSLNGGCLGLGKDESRFRSSKEWNFPVRAQILSWDEWESGKFSDCIDPSAR